MVRAALVALAACLTASAQQTGHIYPPTAFVNPSVDTPVILPVAGTYATAQTVSMTVISPGAEIRYTTDGSTPTCASTLYTGTFSTSSPPSSETVQAIGCAFGLTTSGVASNAYVISNAISILPGANGHTSVTGNGGVTTALNSGGATLIHIWVSDNVAVTAPTDSLGNTWHAETSQTYGATGFIQGFYAYAPTTGSAHTFTCHGSSTKPSCLVTLWQGTLTSSDPLDVQNGAGTTSSPTTLGAAATVTPGATNELILSGLILSTNTSTVPSVNNSFTLSNSDVNTFPKAAGAYLVDSASSSIAATWTWTGGHPCAMAIVVFKHQ